MGIYVFKKDVLVKLLNEVGGGAQGCVCGGGSVHEVPAAVVLVCWFAKMSAQLDAGSVGMASPIGCASLGRSTDVFLEGLECAPMCAGLACRLPTACHVLRT